jgi:hypothetical protein
MAVLFVLVFGLGLGLGAKSGGAEVSGAQTQNADRLFRQSVTLGVPEAELADLVRACRGAGFMGEEIARLLALVERAKLSGLPHHALLNKLREGLAKRAPPEAVQKALEDKARVLQKAKGVVDTLILEGRIVRDYDFAVKMVADALDAGATPAQLLSCVRQNQPPCAAGVPDVREAFADGREKK